MTISLKNKKNHSITPKGVVSVFDLGYRRIKGFPQQLSTLPCKKKRNQKDLSKKEEIEYNRFHSKKIG